MLATAESRRASAQTAAAARWNDAAYRQVEMRVLRPLADEVRAFDAALQLLDAALGRSLTQIRN
jgi:hypothetical protein